MSPHQSFRLTRHGESKHQTDWRDLPRLRRRVWLSVALVFSSPILGVILGSVASLVIGDIQPLFLLLLPLIAFAFCAVSYGNLAYWRCPECGQRFFGTTWYYCVPIGGVCDHCQAAPPAVK